MWSPDGPGPSRRDVPLPSPARKDPTPSHLLPAGWSTSWCLQDGTLQEKFGCHEGRSEFPSEADSGVGSHVQPWLVKEEMEDEPELMEDLPQTETFLLHSVTEQQSPDPWEQLWDEPGEWTLENTQTHGHTLGEATLLLEIWEPRVEELRAAAAKDHSYCLRSEPGAPCALPRPCSLREHSYCQQRRATGSCGDSTAWAPCRRRAWQRRSRCAAMLRTARRILRRYRPYRRLGFPWRGCSVCRAAAQGSEPRVCPPSELQSAGNAGKVTADAPRAPEGIPGSGASTPAPIPAAGARMGEQPLEDCGANGELEGCEEPCRSPGVMLQDLFRNVLRAVGYMLDSLCQKFELQGFSQGKSIWPIVIQIDNLGEIGKP